ncbi:mechanosensitive ion channel family protein [Synechocystis salina]|uniref:Mechanosensitive ion channel family protein n=1 Tax=Synechocystis salina LEGE 00031 TaxID=1828736 RepID=A0ABR9VSE7_9SYNC|nr:mechanosensitive ion channel family protein [Synechocystis salina]MBE9240819.1 mechanosensitive ion channel family protein [Synechocystis salina LEGE 00041]MBE9254279.1 mechanosensitive ion channel family protein [Synechocystis salina LEGE 00031]
MLFYHRIKNWLRNGLIIFLLNLVTLVATAYLVYPQTVKPTANEPKGAPVILGDETLFYIQARIASFSPEFRAQVVSNRIVSLAKNTEVSLNTLKIVDNEAAATADIRAGDETLVTIADVDAVAAGQSRKELANEYLQVIKQSITDFRSSYSIHSLVRGVIYTLIATIILTISLISITKSVPVIYRQLRRWRGTRIPALRLFDTQILSAHRVIDLISEIIKVVRLALLLGVFYLYINLVLSFFPWTKGLARILFEYVRTAISTLVAGLLAYFPNLFFLVIIWLFTSYFLKVIRFLFAEIEQDNIKFQGFYREWAQPTYKLVQFLVLAFAATVAFPYLPGSKTPAFQGISIFLGLLISLGSSSVIANIFAGIMLTYTRAFSVGDRVKITDTIGDVVEKTLFVTRIRTIKNVVITIPNSAVLGSHVINYSAAASDPGAPPLILHTTITLGYDVPWRKVHAVLIEAALVTDQILEDPAPFVLQTSLDDFYIAYELNAYTHNPGIMAKIYSELHQNLQDKCNEADIEILSPHYRAVRDGNQTTIPADYLPSDYEAPAFKVSSLNAPSTKDNGVNTSESDQT